LSSQLVPFAFVERLLEAEEPIWYRWNKDVPALLRELVAVAHRETFWEPSERGFRGWHIRRRKARVFWLLDRLAESTDLGIFEPFVNTSSYAMFAWGRRLKPDERDRLVGEHLESSRLLAWCASCPSTELLSLLDWRETWRPVLKAGGFPPPPNPEEEFYRRCGDRTVRLREMCAHLEAAASCFRQGGEVETSLARASIHCLLHLTVREAAATASCLAESIPDCTEEWSRWLSGTLAAPAFADISRAAGEFLSWLTGEYDARWVWVYCHGPNDWQKLHELALQCGDWFVYDHLADIMPPDRLEEWDSLVLWQSEDHGQMRAFCRWLRPEYDVVLRSHFDHSDSDWGACAYQAHLTKSPEPVLLHEWRRKGNSPGWQVKLLDRRLFAPEAVRPGPFVEDIQDAEADVRLEDPFSRRGL
jgi:hypothetical protein